MKAGGAVGEGEAPLLEAANEIGGDAGVTELFCGLPDTSAGDFAVALGRGVGLAVDAHRQVLGHRVLQVFVHPCGKKRFGQSAM